MQPLPASLWLVAKMTRSAIHQAHMASMTSSITTTSITIRAMNTTLPAARIEREREIQSYLYKVANKLETFSHCIYPTV